MSSHGICVLVVVLVGCAALVESKGWGWAAVQTYNNVSVGWEVVEEEEFYWPIDSQTNRRRVLSRTGTSTGYRVLYPDRAACPKGSAYTQGKGCLTKVNPQSRGCNQIYQCKPGSPMSFAKS